MDRPEHHTHTGPSRPTPQERALLILSHELVPMLKDDPAVTFAARLEEALKIGTAHPHTSEVLKALHTIAGGGTLNYEQRMAFERHALSVVDKYTKQFSKFRKAEYASIAPDAKNEFGNAMSNKEAAWHGDMLEAYSVILNNIERYIKPDIHQLAMQLGLDLEPPEKWR